jgi:hypothetical protein
MLYNNRVCNVTTNEKNYQGQEEFGINYYR